MNLPAMRRRVRRVKPPSPSEFQLHCAVAEYLDLALPPDAAWTTIPAGGGGRVRGAKLKTMGYKAGTADIIVVFRGRAHWIELKVPGRKARDEQMERQRVMSIAGASTAFCFSVSEVQHWLERWGIKLLARA